MKRHLIGLTGNIACGKSSVAAMLAEMGAEVIDADALVHQLMVPGSDSWREIVETFGQGTLSHEGTIDRGQLGEVVFRDPVALDQLEAILHPRVRRLAEERIAASPSPVVVLEAIKLIEAGWASRVDSVWVVTCRRAQQLERLRARRGLSLAEAELRVRAQSPAAEKLKHADVVIDNSGSPRETRAQVENGWARKVKGGGLLPRRALGG